MLRARIFTGIAKLIVNDPETSVAYYRNAWINKVEIAIKMSSGLIQRQRELQTGPSKQGRDSDLNIIGIPVLVLDKFQHHHLVTLLACHLTD